MLEPFPNDPDAQQALAERRVQSHARLKRGVGLLKMSRRLAVTALGLAGWTSIAHAHGEEAVLLMLGIVLVILVAPFAAFLFFWRGSFRSKAILCCAYLAALPLAFYAALSAGISNAGSFSSLSSAFHFPFGCREPAT